MEEAYQPANRPSNSVVVGWRKLAPSEAGPVKVTYYAPRDGIVFNNANTLATSTSAAPTAAASAGKGSSMARFTILNQTLYAVDEQSLRLFSLQNPAVPTASPRVQLIENIETIFPTDHYLFLGTQCVKLRSGRTYSGGANTLQVINMTNFSRPRLVSAFAMFSPQGLGAEKIASTPTTMAWRYLTPADPGPDAGIGQASRKACFAAALPIIPTKDYFFRQVSKSA